MAEESLEDDVIQMTSLEEATDKVIHAPSVPNGGSPNKAAWSQDPSGEKEGPRKLSGGLLSDGLGGPAQVAPFTMSPVRSMTKGHSSGETQARKPTVASSSRDNASLTKEFHEKTSGKRKRDAQSTVKRLKEMQQVGYVIDPRQSKWIGKWDMLMVLALVFTAAVTPVEVSFLKEGEYITPLWTINRVVDLCFMLDICLTFQLAYQESTENGGHWVFNKWTIAKHYLKGWFLLDFLSVVPFWLMSLSFDDPVGEYARAEAAAAAAAALEAGTTVDQQPVFTRGAVLFRVIKLLRMVKLARVLKASRVMQRVLLDFVMNQWEWTYAVLNMIKLFAQLCAYAHWQACLWGLISSYYAMDGYPNWITDFEQTHVDTFGEMPTGMEVYVAALYWSVMTLTSIGYGAMTPINTAERFLCCVYMMSSGVMWTYAIGSVAAIATTLNPNAIMYQNTMDSLNYFMRERDLPRTMRMTLRDYFSAARRVHQLSDDSDLLDKMSPLLQGTVALAANKRWLDQVWFFRDIEELDGGSDFIAALAKSLTIRSYVSHERLPIGQLYILKCGLVVKMWRFMGVGKVWGEDIILDNRELVDHSQAVAISYVESYTLRRNELDDVLAEFPNAAERVAKAARRVTIQRSLLKYLAIQTGKAHPRSVALKSSAHGFISVHEVYTAEQKVDQLYEVVVNGKTIKEAQSSDESEPAPSPRRQSFIKPDSSPLVNAAAVGSIGGSSSSPELVRKVDAIEDQLRSLAAGQRDMAELMKSLAAQMQQMQKTTEL